MLAGTRPNIRRFDSVSKSSNILVNISLHPIIYHRDVMEPNPSDHREWCGDNKAFLSNNLLLLSKISRNYAFRFLLILIGINRKKEKMAIRKSRRPGSSGDLGRY